MGGIPGDFDGEFEQTVQFYLLVRVELDPEGTTLEGHGLSYTGRFAFQEHQDIGTGTPDEPAAGIHRDSIPL
jgi:hypothetical protein